MQAFVNDLRFAQTARLYVEMRLLSGDRLLRGVHDVNEAEGYVSMYVPYLLGNDLTTRKIPLDLIASVSVTDTPCHHG